MRGACSERKGVCGRLVTPFLHAPFRASTGRARRSRSGRLQFCRDDRARVLASKPRASATGLQDALVAGPATRRPDTLNTKTHRACAPRCAPARAGARLAGPLVHQRILMHQRAESLGCRRPSLTCALSLHPARGARQPCCSRQGRWPASALRHPRYSRTMCVVVVGSEAPPAPGLKTRIRRGREATESCTPPDRSVPPGPSPQRASEEWRVAMPVFLARHDVASGPSIGPGRSRRPSRRRPGTHGPSATAYAAGAASTSPQNSRRKVRPTPKCAFTSATCAILRECRAPHPSSGPHGPLLGHRRHLRHIASQPTAPESSHGPRSATRSVRQ